MPSDDCDRTEVINTTSARRETVAFWLVLALCLASRLPFLAAGYGNDPDAWALIHAAQLIHATGEYSASRLPGYPLPEYVYSLLWGCGPISANLCTALLSVAAVGFFALSLKCLRLPDPLFAALALALTPVVFINSTSAIDYVWPLAFVLAAHHFALVQRPIVAGVLLGLAVACRITSVLMLLPLGLLIVASPLVRGAEGRAPINIGAAGDRRRRATGRVSCFCLATVVVAALAYWPVAAKYGLGFLSFRETPSYPDLFSVFSRATLHVWGFVGLLGIALGVFAGLIPRLSRGKPASRADGVGKAPLVAFLITVILYTAVYFRLPHKSGYLVPAIPFVLVLLNCFLARRTFRFICAALCLSPFIGNLGGARSAPASTYSAYTADFTIAHRPLSLDFLCGPALHDYAERRYGIAFVDDILHTAAALPSDSEVVVGYWLPQIQVALGSTPTRGARFIYLLDAAELSRCRTTGITIYYLPEMAPFIREAFDLDLRGAGAIPLDLHWCR